MKSIGSYFQVKSKEMNIKLSAIVNRQVKPNDIIVIDDSSADEKDIEDECRVDGESVQYLKDDSQEIYNLSAETKMEPMTENPFIQFAHGLGASESSYFSTSAPLPTLTNTKEVSKTNISRNTTHATTRKDTKRKRKRKELDVENFASKSEEELIECMQKWQSMAVEDAPLEIRRFQVLVAARLHAQSQEPVVRKAMKALHSHFHNTSDTSKVNSVFLCCETLSEADPEIISSIISSVLFANVKSKHIIKAAREVKTTFSGIVPTSQHGLKSITGIGPHLAELLFYVNSPKAFAKIESLKVS